MHDLPLLIQFKGTTIYTDQDCYITQPDVGLPLHLDSTDHIT
jgi:hypothetical protein